MPLTVCCRSNTYQISSATVSGVGTRCVRFGEVHVFPCCTDALCLALNYLKEQMAAHKHRADERVFGLFDASNPPNESTQFHDMKLSAVLGKPGLFPAKDSRPIAPIDRIPHPVSQSRTFLFMHDDLHGTNHGQKCENRSLKRIFNIDNKNSVVAESAFSDSNHTQASVSMQNMAFHSKSRRRCLITIY